MKGIGIFVALLGVATFVLPLLNVPIFYTLGNFRPFAAIILILIGAGLFFFSASD